MFVFKPKLENIRSFRQTLPNLVPTRLTSKLPQPFQLLQLSPFQHLNNNSYHQFIGWLLVPFFLKNTSKKRIPISITPDFAFEDTCP